MLSGFFYYIKSQTKIKIRICTSGSRTAICQLCELLIRMGKLPACHFVHCIVNFECIQKLLFHALSHCRFVNPSIKLYQVSAHFILQVSVQVKCSHMW